MIYAGDAFRFLKRLDDESVDVMITDPPYSEHTHSKSLRSATKDTRTGHGKKNGEPVARVLGFDAITTEIAERFAREAKRLTKRWVLVFSDDHGVAMWRALLADVGLDVVRTMIWIKPNAAPQLTGDRPGTGWEAIILAHATRSRNRPMKKRWNGGGRHGVFVHPIEQRFRPNGDPRTHTTEKPIALMLELVSLFSDRGELVVDPFAGSGTTGAACIRLDRRFEGAERDKKIATEAIERLAAERVSTTIRARANGQRALFEESKAS